MSMDELDFTDVTPTSVERSPYLDPGLYVACVTDVTPDDKTGAMVLKFEVVHGPDAGRTITERLWDPKKADTPAKAESSLNKLRLWTTRLGMVAKDDFGKKVKLNWNRAIGATVVIEVKKYKYKDKSGADKEGTQIDWGGVYPFGHEKMPPAANAIVQEFHAGGGGSGGRAVANPGGGGGAGGSSGRQKVTDEDLADL